MTPESCNRLSAETVAYSSQDGYGGKAASHFQRRRSLCCAEHEKAHANAAYVPVLTGEYQVFAK